MIILTQKELDFMVNLLPEMSYNFVICQIITVSLIISTWMVIGIIHDIKKKRKYQNTFNLNKEKVIKYRKKISLSILGLVTFLTMVVISILAITVR